MGRIKKEIEKVRSSGYENTDIIDMSEKYFGLADNTVSAAERYSEKIAQHIKLLEIASAADMIVLILIIVQRTMFSIKITRMNKQLEKTAYLDLYTGLPNKSYCEKFLNSDQFILNFSNLLRNTIPAQDFVGRYGGDEFMAVIYNASNEKINRINVKLEEEVKKFNKLKHSGERLDIKYAHGCAFSEDYSQCTFITLFNRADKNMYKDKMRSKNLTKTTIE